MAARFLVTFFFKKTFFAPSRGTPWRPFFLFFNFLVVIVFSQFFFFFVVAEKPGKIKCKETQATKKENIMKRNASKRYERVGRWRRRPTNQSFGVFKVNFATLKVATIRSGRRSVNVWVASEKKTGKEETKRQVRSENEDNQTTEGFQYGAHEDKAKINDKKTKLRIRL